MPRRPVSTNYSGRLVDLLIFQNTSLFGERKVHTGFAGDEGGFFTTGIQKLAQTYAIFLLNTKGSVLSDPTIGTELAEKAKRGLLQTNSQLKTEFEMANDLVRQRLARITDANPGQAADETFESATLLSSSVDPATGILKLQIKITSAAGDSFTFFLPTSVPIK